MRENVADDDRANMPRRSRTTGSTKEERERGSVGPSRTFAVPRRDPRSLERSFSNMSATTDRAKMMIIASQIAKIVYFGTSFCYFGDF
uniref:Uncharacterized protein n=1 Tax=Panagrellus redivivus TaxID=6233 RepID=A0A7E4UXB5_PANRE